MTAPRILAVSAALALVLSACGADADEPAPSAEPTPPTTVAADPTASTRGSDDPDTGRVTDPEPASPTATAAAAPSPPPSTTDADPGSATSPTTTAPRSPSRYVPPAGTYRYDVTGHHETSGVGGGREPLPPTSTDTVTVTGEEGDQRVTVVTRDEGRDSTQETVVDVTGTDARLVRLTYRPGETAPGYDVRPDPPATLARFPYRTGDRWEIAWSDPTSGVSGVGTGAVDGAETVTTPSGDHQTIVITVTQRLRGAVNGTLTATTWIDPTSGVQVKQHIVTDLDDVTGSSRTESTRLLRSHEP